MSIAVACQSDEGIVLCTDTLFTSTNNTQSHGSKLWREMGETEPWQVYFAYSGMGLFVDSFRERFREAVQTEQHNRSQRGADSQTTISLLRDSIETALTWLRAQERHDNYTGAELLCVISTGQQPLALYRTHGDLVSRVSEIYSILNDTPLTKCLVPILFNNGQTWDAPHAIVAAAYTVCLASSFVHGCGLEDGFGPPAWFIKPNHTFVILGDSTMASIRRRLIELHYSLIQLGVTFGSRRITQDVVEGYVAQFTQRFSEEHRAIGEMIHRAIRTRL
jgi:hypothetical protein